MFSIIRTIRLRQLQADAAALPATARSLALAEQLLTATMSPAPETSAPEPWVPLGTVVDLRFSAVGGAEAVLFHSTCDIGHFYQCLYCTGCQYTRSHLAGETARTAANDHAGACRAQITAVPAPDDDQARELVLKVVREILSPLHGGSRLALGELGRIRVKLQRDDTWLHRELAALATQRPDLLEVDPWSTDWAAHPAYRKPVPELVFDPIAPGHSASNLVD